MKKKKASYNLNKHIFTAPIGGIYLINYKYYNLEKGEIIEIEFMEEGKTADEAWKKALKKLKPEDFLVK